MRASVLLCLVAVAVLAVLPASADISIGSAARQAGMGGAGLAIMDNPSKTAYVNPAALAYCGSYFKFPTLDWRYEGPSLDTIIDAVQDAEEATVETAIYYAQQLGRQTTELGLSSELGLKIGPVEVGARGYCRGILEPNQLLKDWVANPVTPAPADGAAASMQVAAMYSLPSVGYAQTLPIFDKKRGLNLGTLAVGGRWHLWHSASTYGDVSWAGGTATSNVLDEPIEDTDWSLDLGTLFSPALVPNLTVAAVFTLSLIHISEPTRPY